MSWANTIMLIAWAKYESFLSQTRLEFGSSLQLSIDSNFYSHFYKTYSV